MWKAHCLWNWLAPGRAVPPGSARPRDVKYQGQELGNIVIAWCCYCWASSGKRREVGRDHAALASSARGQESDEVSLLTWSSSQPLSPLLPPHTPPSHLTCHKYINKKTRPSIYRGNIMLFPLSQFGGNFLFSVRELKQGFSALPHHGRHECNPVTWIWTTEKKEHCTWLFWPKAPDTKGVWTGQRLS